MRRKAVHVWLDFRNAIYRRGLHAFLREGGFAVVGESAGLVPEPDLRDADILLFDIDGSSVERAADITRESSVKVVGIVGDTTEELLLEAMQSGFCGLLAITNLTPEGLLGSLAAVVSGNESISPDLLGRMLEAHQMSQRGRASDGTELAPREIEVLRLLAEGGSTTDIASSLRYSERTVKNIVHDALIKMNCRTRAHAVALATRLGVI